MAERKKILVLTSTFPRWAGDTEPPFVFELSRRLAEQFAVTVLCPHAADAQLREHMAGLEVLRFRYFPSRWQTLAYEGGILANLKKNPLNYLLVPFFILAQFASVVRLLRKQKFDVIHAHWLIPQGLVALGARLLAGPNKPAIICTSHGGDLFGLSGALFSWLKRHIIRRVENLTVVSQAMRDYAQTLAGRPDIDVIPMGADLQHVFVPPAAAARNPNHILFVGRLVEKKGVHYLIEAMPAVLSAHPQAMLLIAGDGPERGKLEQLAAALHVQEQVRFLGKITNADLSKYYGQVAIFVAPSVVAAGGDQEGLGLVLVEALGCECAAIASDLPAIRDVLSDGITGLLCRQRDSVDLAAKISFLLSSVQVRERIAVAGRRHVLRHFDWETVAHRYGMLMKKLTGGAG